MSRRQDRVADRHRDPMSGGGLGSQETRPNAAERNKVQPMTWFTSWTRKPMCYVPQTDFQAWKGRDEHRR